MRRFIRRLFITTLAIGAGLTLLIRVLYGGAGEPYEDLTGPPLIPERAIEIVAASQQPIGNVAVGPDGRLFFTIHPESRPDSVKLVEWVDGRAVPYPDAAAQAQFLAPLGVRIDRQNRLWVLDHGRHGLERARLVAFDLASGTITKEVVFDREAAPIGSFLNDLVVDPAGETVYISDASFFRKSPAIVVLDVANGSARRVLEKHRSVVAENWRITTPSRTMVLPGGLVALRAGVGGITLSGDGEWLYYGAMNHAHAYRVRAADVRSRHLNAPALAATAERISAKPLSDGMTTDVAGNLLITDVEHGAVLRFRTNGRLETLVRSLRIRWADGLSFGPDGWLYIADSALPDVLLRSKDQMRIRAPYHIYRFRPDTPGVPGQ